MTVLTSDVVQIRSGDDVVRVRQEVRARAVDSGLSLVDQTKIITAASELARNTLDYGGGGTMLVERLQDGVRRGVRLTFEDQGPGIREDEMPHVFQEFVRLRNRPTAGEASSGVGLSITRDLVHLHSGQIGVESRVGEGSLFWVELPCEQLEVVKQKVAQAS